MAAKVLIPLTCLLFLMVAPTSTTDFNGCLGENCCDKVELFPTDRLTLEGSRTAFSSDNWCDRVVIVRQNSDKYDECKGCSLTVQFVEYTEPFPGTVELLQGNYSSVSYFSSEMLYLDSVATYGGEDTYIPSSIRSPGTVLKIVFTLPYYDRSISGDIKMKMVITPNTPPQSSNVGVIIGITVPMVVLFIVFNVVIYKLRQRRIAIMREQLRSRLTAIVVDAAMDAAVLQQARARQHRQPSPHSPDPTDSVAPPSYTEANPPPPKYEDIVLDDSAAPETGRDDRQLIIDA